MKTDNLAGSARGGQPDRIARAHLRAPGDTTHTIHRYPAPPEVADLMDWFWHPVWSVPAGTQSLQRVLQYPACLLVVSSEYARFYGVVPGLSTTTLVGDGWAAGVMLTPGAGFLLARTSIEDFTGTHVELADLFGEPGRQLVTDVRGAMADDPHSLDAHEAVGRHYRDFLLRFGPLDDEGLLLNELVRYIETDPTVLRVAQLVERFSLTERSLQRLVRRRLGLTPKWLIQRRRLQEAAQRLRDRSADPAQLAFLLGYADQPHFIRDFRQVTEMTPGEYAASFRS